MLGIVLTLTTALLVTGSPGLHYELEFATSKTYVYDYEGLVLSGLQEQGFAKSGLKLKCRAEISGATASLRFLKIRNIEIQEYNGIWPTDKFTSSGKLTRLLEKQLENPIKFEYNRGQVGDLHIPNGLSETTVNILRGIVNILQITVRKTQNTYIVQENGIQGFCNNNYLIQEDQKSKQLAITKSIDLNDCEHKEQMVLGNAYLHTCANCKKRNKNSRATATYNYKVKGTEMGGRLLKAEVREIHQFTPFHELEGSMVFEARQRLVLQAVQEQIHSTPENNDYITKESLRYHFEKKLIQTPIHLLRTKNTESQIDERMHHLVQHIVGPLSKLSPEKYIEMVHLLRVSKYEQLESLWKQYSGRTHYRRWFLDAVPAIGNHLSLRFLKVKLRELSEFEAAQAVPLALHLIEADREAIAEAKSLLEAVKSRHGSLLRKVTYLAYGSLVYKFCSMADLCPEEALQPLHDLLLEATETVHKEDVILALKSLGNAGQVKCIKLIMKYIPGFSSMASNLPLPVQAAAVMALRNMALKHPSKVLDICLQLYMDLQQHPVLRMIAAGLIMDSKPPANIVMAMAKSMMKEGDMHVGSFVYYLMKRQSTSVTPDQQDVAAICNMAVTILKFKFEATRVKYQSGFHYSTFTDSLMSGIESTFNIMHNPAGVLPVAALGRLKTYFMGVFTDLFEIGYHAEGLQELLMNTHLFSSQSGLQKTIMDMLKKLHDWKPISSIEPLASVYLNLFGQEILYHELDKNLLESILKSLSSGRYANLLSAMTALLNGVDINWSKGLLSSENVHIVPTCVGLPLETSLHYSSVTRAQLQAQAHLSLDPKDPNFVQLLQPNINLKSKFSLSMTKDIVIMMGVNTNIIQAGMELRTQINILLPVNVEAAINVEQKHFKIDYIPIEQNNEILSIRSKAFAITRNVEDLAAAKMTPLVAAGTEPNVLKQTFNPKDLSAGDTPRTEGEFSAEVFSKEKAYWSGQPHRQAHAEGFSICPQISHFGFQICLEKNSVTAGFAQNCPFYHMIGDHSFKLLVKPAHADASVEKIQIEFQAGPGAAMKMVRSVNVQRTDGEIHEMENPTDRMALSKLKKILGSSNVILKEANMKDSSSTSSSNSSSNSGNTSEFSMGSSSSATSGHKSNQEKKHKTQMKHKNHQKHQNIHHHKGQGNSQEAHQFSRGHHETEQIHEHGHNKDKEMEIHCKCWPEKQQKHTKGQHGLMEHDKHHKSHEHEARKHESNQKIQHGTGKNKNPHKDAQDKGHPHSGHQEEHNGKRWQKGEEHHQGKNQKKDQRGEAEDHIRQQKGQHRKEEQKGQHQTDKHERKGDQWHEEHDQTQYNDKEKHPHQAGGHHHESKDEKRHCTCWRRQKNEPKNIHKVHGKTIRKTGKIHLADVNNTRMSQESQYDSGASSNYMIHSLLENQMDDPNQFENNSSQVGDLQIPKGFTETTINMMRGIVNILQITVRKPRNTYIVQKKTQRSSSGSKSGSSSSGSRSGSSSSGSRSGSSSSSSSSSGMNSLPYENLSSRTPPKVVLLVKSIMSNAQHQGLQTTAYLDTTKMKAQVVTVPLDHKSSWKTCFDVSVSAVHKVSALLRWGDNCQDYRVVGQLSTGKLAGSPAVQLSLQWKSLPTWLKRAAGSLMTFAPGVAYTMGFSEMHRSNPSHQVTVRVAAASTDTFDAILKTPELTFYKQAVPIPWDLSLGTRLLRHLHLIELTNLPKVSSMVRGTQEGQCVVDEENIVTFDGRKLGCSLSARNCYTVISQDCTNQLRFLIAMKTTGQGFSTFEMNVKLGSSDIKIYPNSTGEFRVLLNGMWLLLQNDTYTSDKDGFTIRKTAETVTLNASRNGIEKISFNGQTAKIKISPLMSGKTCGLCGNADQNPDTDFRKPNRQMARSCTVLVHSWTLPVASCGCALGRQYIMLENELIEEHQSTCYSTEPVLRCAKGCHPETTVPITVGFHCLPTESAMGLEDWQANPKVSSEDLIKEVEAPTSCLCTEECAKNEQTQM